MDDVRVLSDPVVVPGQGNSILSHKAFIHAVQSDQLIEDLEYLHMKVNFLNKLSCRLAQA